MSTSSSFPSMPGAFHPDTHPSKAMASTNFSTAAEIPSGSFPSAAAISTDHPPPNGSHAKVLDSTTSSYYNHSTAPRINTDVLICEALRKQYPNLSLTVTPAIFCALLPYAAAGNATATALTDTSSPLNSSYSWRRWAPPARRLDGGSGFLFDTVLFGKYLYKWRAAPGLKEHEFVVYIADGRDGDYPFGQQYMNYILCAPDAKPGVNALIGAASAWMLELRQEVLVFDGGYWQKSRELWESVQRSSWDDVILDPQMKRDIIGDVDSFFASRDTYADLKVPWKRGIIYYGPPGNGKTISIKAMMHALSQRHAEPIPTLYVKTLTSFGGPEYSVKQIFSRPRQEAPCYLVFEDLDSIVSDRVRSYFLNEVDGLKSNDGIFMVGSTNHLERLDPGIAKRPSRFDRKYFFPNPDRKEREAYCRFWQGKVGKENGRAEFPDALCPAVAEITGGFSFAYIQEAFVAALLAIARRGDDDGDEDEDKGKEGGKGRGEGKDADEKLSDAEEGDEIVILEKEDAGISTDKNDDSGDDHPEDKHPELDKYELWAEIKRQVRTLREGLDDTAAAAAAAGGGARNGPCRA